MTSRSSIEDGRADPDPDEPQLLTVAGVAVCDEGSEDVDTYIRLLPWLALKDEPGDGRSRAAASSPAP
jgi:hypothetical protein